MRGELAAGASKLALSQSGQIIGDMEVCVCVRECVRGPLEAERIQIYAGRLDEAQSTHQSCACHSIRRTHIGRLLSGATLAANCIQ